MTRSLGDAVDGRSMLEWAGDLRDQFHPDVRGRAVDVLVTGDAGVARAVLRGADPMWGNAVEDSQRAVLLGIGAAAVVPMIEELGSAAAWEGFLVPTLAAIGQPAVGGLWDRAVDRGTPDFARGRALKALTAMRPLPEGLTELLSRLMRDPGETDEVRTAAAVCIASWDRAYVEACPEGAEMLHGYEAREREIRAGIDAALLDAPLAASAGPAVASAAPAEADMSPRARLVADAIAAEEPLRVRCDTCMSVCLVAGKPIPPSAVVLVTPEVARVAARYCPGCHNVSCPTCAGTIASTGMGAGGKCPRCLGATVPADVTHLADNCTTVLRADRQG